MHRFLRLSAAGLVLVAALVFLIVADGWSDGELSIQSLQPPAAETPANRPVVPETPEDPAVPNPPDSDPRPELTGVDTVAPQILSLSIEPNRVDTTAHSETITVTARITDDLSGLWELEVRFAPENGTTQFVDVILHGDTNVAGDGNQAAVWNILSVPKFAVHGKWVLVSVSAIDRAGNRCGGNANGDGQVVAPECVIAGDLPFFVNSEDGAEIEQPPVIAAPEPGSDDPAAPVDGAPEQRMQNSIYLPALR